MLEGVSRHAPDKASSGGVHPRGVSAARGRSSGSEGASSGAHRSLRCSQLWLGTGGSLLWLHKVRCEADGGRQAVWVERHLGWSCRLNSMELADMAEVSPAALSSGCL
jgi:hypothetical protein